MHLNKENKLKLLLNKDLSIKNILLVENLKHNLINISQLCDNGFKVTLVPISALLGRLTMTKSTLKDIDVNVYKINLDDFKSSNKVCPYSSNDDSSLWHRRLGHASMDTISKLLRKDLIKGLSKLDFSKDKICHAC